MIHREYHCLPDGACSSEGHDDGGVGYPDCKRGDAVRRGTVAAPGPPGIPEPPCSTGVRPPDFVIADTAGQEAQRTRDEGCRECEPLDAIPRHRGARVPCAESRLQNSSGREAEKTDLQKRDVESLLEGFLSALIQHDALTPWQRCLITSRRPPKSQALVKHRHAGNGDRERLSDRVLFRREWRNWQTHQT